MDGFILIAIVVACITLYNLYELYLLHKCKHSYELINTSDYYLTCSQTGRQLSKLPHKRKYTHKCQKCGKIKIDIVK